MNAEGAYDWVLFGLGTIVGTVLAYWLWVRVNHWRQDRRSRRRHRREFL